MLYSLKIEFDVDDLWLHNYLNNPFFSAKDIIRIRFCDFPTEHEFYARFEEECYVAYRNFIDGKRISVKPFSFDDNVRNLLVCARQERLYERYLNDQTATVSSTITISVAT